MSSTNINCANRAASSTFAVAVDNSGCGENREGAADVKENESVRAASPADTAAKIENASPSPECSTTQSPVADNDNDTPFVARKITVTPL